MSDIPAIKKQLKIKTGSLTRLVKEDSMYRKETKEMEQKLERLTTENAEEWDIKNARKMLEESNKMIIDTTTRVEKAAGELEDLVARAKEKPELAETEELIKAKEILEKAKQEMT